MVRAALRAGAVLCAAAVVVACSEEFPNSPDRAITIEAVGWPTELHATDVDTVEVRVRFRDSPEEITGLRLTWISSADEALQVVPLTPVTGGGRADTLLAQRRAEITAELAAGQIAVHVIVETGGFEPAESTYVIRVVQKWTAVSAGAAHTCAINVDSLAYCWGQGDKGRLGNGRLGSATPAQVLGDFKFAAVSAGNESSCGITRDHLAYCWGSNADGRLGNGDPTEQSQFLPSLVVGVTFSSLDVGTVVCGLGENLFAYCWGSNADNQLGHRPGELPALDVCLSSIPCRLTPLRISRNDTTPTSYRQITVGAHHSCGISQAPDSLLAFCWGRNTSGALGNAAVTTTSPTAVPVAGGLTFSVIAAGVDYTCGIASSGATFCWGANGNGQLGHGAGPDLQVPGPVTSGAFVSLAAGAQHACALTADGAAACWGRGSSGELGNGSTVMQQPTPMAVSGGLRFTALSSGDTHTCGLTREGSLYCWGKGTNGQLGTGDLPNQRPTPARVAEP